MAQMVGNDPGFIQAIQQIPLVAAIDAPVLLTGETGTGKELCARAIHLMSRRHSGPFIPVECGALPENLAENELFGHVRGAFTDAQHDQKGLVGMAEAGTLFLDEIDTLSLSVQAKLLRLLEENCYRVLGGEQFSKANIRVIAATNGNIEECVRRKVFRSDLYYRLNVLRLHLPPLRERRVDVGLLAAWFLDSLCKSTGSARKLLSSAALRKLEGYDWPGNVRELFNLIQRAAVLSTGSLILPCYISLPESAEITEGAGETFRQARTRAVERFEHQYILGLLSKHHGNITKAALEARKERRAFGRLAKKYGIRPEAA
jgi:DNA-binding NtrC family response regulator